jgi:hypothetical protein
VVQSSRHKSERGVFRLRAAPDLVTGSDNLLFPMKTNTLQDKLDQIQKLFDAECDKNAELAYQIKKARDLTATHAEEYPNTFAQLMLDWARMNRNL